MHILSATLLAAVVLTNIWYDEGEPVPDSEWRKSVGDFGAMLILTSEPEQLLENWGKPTDGVQMTSSSEVTDGEAIVGFVIFSGCQVAANDLCDLTVAYTMIGPDGEVLLESGPVELWQNKSRPPGYSIELGVGYAGFEFEDGDLIGEYTFIAEVRDQIAEKDLRLVRTFEAKSAASTEE